jgi:hypothetical protein
MQPYPGGNALPYTPGYNNNANPYQNNAFNPNGLNNFGNPMSTDRNLNPHNFNPNYNFPPGSPLEAENNGFNNPGQQPYEPSSLSKSAKIGFIKKVR